MAERKRIRMTVGKLGQQFDLDFYDGEIADGPTIGVHYLCQGFVHKRDISSTHYVLFCSECGSCGLESPIPKEVQTKEQVLDFFIQRGFHKKGEEKRVCLDCEGKGWKRQTEFVEEDELYDLRFRKRTKEVTTTIDCPQCKSTGILPS